MPVNKSANDALFAITSEGDGLSLVAEGEIMKPGQYIARAKVQTPPRLIVPYTSGTYIVIALDMDAPFPSFSVLGPICHWIQSGLKPSEDAATGVQYLTSNVPAIAYYAGPGPPPGSAPHRYAFFLYEQPDGFDIQKHAPSDGKPMGVSKRMRYDLDKFEKDAGLSSILRVAYFRSN